MSLLTDIMSWDTILTRDEMAEIEKICSRARWQWGASSDHTAPHKKFWKMDVKDMLYLTLIFLRKLKSLYHLNMRFLITMSMDIQED